MAGFSQRVTEVARHAVELAPMPQPGWRPTRYPVMLMHGFGAMANLMQGGVLHAEAMHLRTRGIAAYAPHVNPYDTLDVRARAWAARLNVVMEETGAERVNLIAFSSGGLDARVLATDLGWADRIASLVTVSTPHRGSEIADFVVTRPQRLRAIAIGVMDFVGRSAWESAPPRALDAIAELRPQAVRCRFGDETLPDAWCASYDSAAGQGTDVPMFPPLLVPNRILYRLAGLNDGIVPTSAMAWGEPLGRLHADHARQIGLGPGASARFDSCGFFEGHCGRLRDRGL